MSLKALEKIFRRSQKEEAIEIKKPQMVQTSAEVIMEYSVGLYKISIVRDMRNRILYIASSSISDKFRKKIRDRIDDVMLFIKADADVSSILTKVYSIKKHEAMIAYSVLREMLRYGPIQPLIDDPYIEDISITGSGSVWIRHSRISDMFPELDMIETNIYLTEPEVEKMQQVIASRCKTYISTSRPIVDAQLPIEDGGHRVHIVAKTISNRPEIVIRKRRYQLLFAEDLIEEGTINRAIAEYANALIRKNGSMIIAGPPGSGKTTLLRSIIYSYVPPSWKIVRIEDTPEIDPLPNSSWSRYTVFEMGAVRVDLFDLAKAALRSSATKLLVIGETRGAETQVLVQAMNAGMGGLSTFHAGSPEEVIVRLRSHPISLSYSQISMFWSIIIMGFQHTRPRRVVKKVVELIPNGDDPPEIVEIYDRDVDGENLDPDRLIRRSRRIHMRWL